MKNWYESKNYSLDQFSLCQMNNIWTVKISDLVGKRLNLCNKRLGASSFKTIHKNLERAKKPNFDLMKQRLKNLLPYQTFHLYSKNMLCSGTKLELIVDFCIQLSWLYTNNFKMIARISCYIFMDFGLNIINRWMMNLYRFIMIMILNRKMHRYNFNFCSEYPSVW